MRTNQCEVAVKLGWLKLIELVDVKRQHFLQLVVSVWVLPTFYAYSQRRVVVSRRPGPEWVSLSKFDAWNCFAIKYFLNRCKILLVSSVVKDAWVT